MYGNEDKVWRKWKKIWSNVNFVSANNSFLESRELSPPYPLTLLSYVSALYCSLINTVHFAVHHGYILAAAF